MRTSPFQAFMDLPKGTIITGTLGSGKFHVHYPWEESERIAKECRREMRGWAKWWRRGSNGSRADIVLGGAKTMRDLALNMEAQAARLKAGSK